MLLLSVFLFRLSTTNLIMLMNNNQNITSDLIKTKCVAVAEPKDVVINYKKMIPLSVNIERKKHNIDEMLGSCTQ